MIIRKFATLFGIITSGIKSYRGVKNSIFLNAEQTVRMALDRRLSIIRMGDGEINILRGKGVSYQIWSAELQRKMNDVVQDYAEGKCNYLLCMPGEFLCPKSSELNWNQLKSWSFSRDFFLKHLDFDIVYGDAFLFAKDNRQVYEKIWKSLGTDEIVFVHNDKKYARSFEEEYSIATHYIEIPKKNAFELIELIENKILNVPNICKKMVLLSAGPAGKIIVRDLSEKGIWCIDTGHCWDEPLMLR